MKLILHHLYLISEIIKTIILTCFPKPENEMSLLNYLLRLDIKILHLFGHIFLCKIHHGEKRSHPDSFHVKMHKTRGDRKSNSKPTYILHPKLVCLAKFVQKFMPQFWLHLDHKKSHSKLFVSNLAFFIKNDLYFFKHFFQFCKSYISVNELLPIFNFLHYYIFYSLIDSKFFPFVSVWQKSIAILWFYHFPVCLNILMIRRGSSELEKYSFILDAYSIA